VVFGPTANFLATQAPEPDLWLTLGSPTILHPIQLSSVSLHSFIAYLMWSHLQQASVLSGAGQLLELKPNVWHKKHLSGRWVLGQTRHKVHKQRWTDKQMNGQSDWPNTHTLFYIIIFCLLYTCIIFVDGTTRRRSSDIIRYRHLSSRYPTAYCISRM